MFKRFFATLRPRRVPDWLHQKLNSEFAKYPPDAPLAGNSQIVRNAKKITEALEIEAEKGCEDSRNLIEGIAEFRKPTSTALPLTNVPVKDIRVTEYLSRIIATIFNPELRVAERLFFLRRKSHISNMSPHSDGAAKGHELQLTQLSGIISDGSVSTYVMDANDLHQRLSKETQQILREPIFGYIKEGCTECVDKSLLPLKLPIFYDGKDGALNINLFYSSRNFLQYDETKTSFLEKQIKDAIEQIHDTIDDLLREGKIEKFYIKEGEMLNLKNKATLHGIINESGLFDPYAPFSQEEPAKRETHRGVLIVSQEDPTRSPNSPQFFNLTPSKTTSPNQI